MKIGSHLTKLSPIMQCPVFMDHGVFLTVSEVTNRNYLENMK